MSQFNVAKSSSGPGKVGATSVANNNQVTLVIKKVFFKIKIACIKAQGLFCGAFWFLSGVTRSLVEILFMHSSPGCDPGDGWQSAELLSHAPHSGSWTQFHHINLEMSTYYYHFLPKNQELCFAEIHGVILLCPGVPVLGYEYPHSNNSNQSVHPPSASLSNRQGYRYILKIFADPFKI